VSRKKRPGGTASEHDIVARAEWISARLDEYVDGVHVLGEPALLLDSALHPSVDAVYREFDSAELFHEAVLLRKASAFERRDGLLAVGEINGDELLVDAEGRVWRKDQDLGELVWEGTRFDRWLAGVVDAEGLLIDHNGEFRDDLFDEIGELQTRTAIDKEQRHLKRDPKAVGPRWRLARALVDAEELERARDELEKVVEAQPDFAWGWFDLARVSEALGAVGSASEEAEMAAGPKRRLHEHAGFFLAHAARLADLAGDEARARALAERALQADPEIAGRQREGARELIAEGAREAARELLLVARAVAPKDLDTLALLRQLEA
jgi:tetratricopeptide (TPR) repeat protein